LQIKHSSQSPRESRFDRNPLQQFINRDIIALVQKNGTSTAENFLKKSWSTTFDLLETFEAFRDNEELLQQDGAPLTGTLEHRNIL